MQKKLNRLLNCLLVIIFLIAFVLVYEYFKYNNEYPAGSIYEYSITMKGFNGELKKPINLDGIDIQVDSYTNPNEFSKGDLSRIYPVAKNVPLFYGEGPNLKIDCFDLGNKYDYSKNKNIFHENVTLYLNKKTKNITNKIKISNNEIVNLNRVYGFFDMINIFPYKDDIYLIAPIDNIGDLKGSNTKYEYITNATDYGYNPLDGSIKYGLVNLTSNEKTKVIYLNTKTGKSNIKENEYTKRIHDKGINAKSCFEVKDKIQIIFATSKDIPNKQLKKLVDEKLSNTYSKYNDNSSIILSINKKDFNKFINCCKEV